MNKKDIVLFLLTIGLLVFLSSCQMGRSDYMSEEQRKELEATYDSLQSNYEALLTSYESGSDTLPAEWKSLYGQMQKMHSEMNANHRQMMSMHMDRHMRGDKMMAQGMGMHMQNNMTGEWYSQMMSLHDRMAHMHQNMGQKSMADMNRELSERYSKMRQMTPSADEPSEVPFNKEGDPSLLNGESLFAQNCASCHGNNAEGIGNAFPPLVNSKWITADKSVPVRILLHGLSGEIEVNGQSYQGSMPSFKARLSAAEMAAILNHLREESEGDQPNISQEDIIRISNTYSDRATPWNAEELNVQE